MKKFLLLICVMACAGMAFSQTQYYSQDFEAGLPTDWSSEDQWAHGNNASLSSQYLAYDGNATNFMAFNDDGAGNGHTGGGSLQSAMIDLTAVSAPLFLEMNVFFANGDYGGADETFKVQVSTDGSTWTEIADFGGLAWSTELVVFDDYAGQNVWLRFDYDDGAAWNFGCAIDDIIIADEPINAVRRDYTVTADGGSQFTQCAPNVDYTVDGLVLNRGFEAITSFDVNVSTGGSVVSTTTFDNVNIEKNGAYRYQLPEKLNTGEAFAIYEVSISNVNGETDEDEVTADNTVNVTFNPQMNLHPEQAVVVEEATGTWCTWCPRGTVYIGEMSKRFPKNFVGIAVHNGDPMVLDEYDSAITSFPGFQGFPSVVYNRESIQDPADIVTPTISDASATPVATIQVGAEEDGSTLSTSVKVTFNQAVSANHNVVVILTEDGLTGPAADGWNQVSGAYSGGGNGPMGGFEYLPGSVPSEWWPYDHVGRALIGGYDGLNEIVGDFEAGSSPSVFMPDFTLPADWNKEKLHVIAVLTDASGQVVNAVSGSYQDAIDAGSVTDTEELLDQSFASVYPNPADDLTVISMDIEKPSQVSVELLDNLGRVVATQNYGELSGRNQVTLDVSAVNAGMYLMNIRVDNQLVSKKISIL